MSYLNTPQVSASYQDGNFDTVTPSLQPKILILGTATDGSTTSIWRVGSLNSASRQFKNYGTLIKAMYEVTAQGADNIFLSRLATGTPASLSGIGSDTEGGGITVTSIEEDGDTGDRYSIWFTASTGRLAIYDNESEDWIYDTDEILAIDKGLISVEGSITIGDGVDIGTASAPVALVDCPDVDSNLVYTAGTDGESPSKMELYEALNDAYEGLDWSDFDFIVPAGATLDTANVADLSSGQISSLGLSTLTTYPEAGTSKDVLGKVFIQDYEGTFYYWWDTDNDGVAEIFPSEGSADATHDIDGNTLSSTDFHEVNFAYQLAELCRKASTTWHTCVGFIGVERPEGFDKASLARWAGKSPTYTELSDGSLVIASTGDNGTGLLGNKFMAGKKDFRGSVKYGGFIQTDDGFLDGTEQVDSNGKYVDIGKHIVIPALYTIHLNQYVNPSNPTGRPAPYIDSSAALVAGKYATLLEKEEANGLNGIVKACRIDGIKLPGRTLNSLLGFRYIGMRSEPSVGVILSGSKTAARPDSNWAKISTIRSANRECQGLRSIFFRYLGKEFSPNMVNAMQTAADSFLKEEGSLGFHSGAKWSFYYTPALRVLGQLKGKLKMVPPFSIEQVDIEMSLTDDESRV